MRLLRLYPRTAARPCSECQQWWYDDKGELLTRGGKPVPRPATSKPPCAKCPKVPPGTERPRPEAAVELTPEHVETYRFYRECRAVNEFPSDPIVRWAAAVIRRAEDLCDGVQSQRAQLTVLSLLRGAE